MKLHSPQFERSLRRGVKAAIKKSPALKREYRKANKFTRHYSSYIFARVFFWALLGGMVALVNSHTGHPTTALAAVSFLTFLVVFGQAQGIILRLFTSTDLSALALLPITEDTIFRWQFQKFLRRSIFHFVDIFAALTTLACTLDFSFLQWCAVGLISILTWLTSLAASAFCAARVPLKRYIWVTKAFVPLLVIFAFISGVAHKPILIDFLDRAAPVLNFLLPTGWAVSQFQLLMPHPDWLLLFFLIPIIALITTLPASLARLRSFYAFREISRAQANDLAPETPDVASPSPAAAPLAAEQRPPARRGPTEIMDLIRSRVFLAPPQWHNRGRLASFLWRWLTPRERILSEFAFPKGLSLTKNWKKVAIVLAVTFAISFSLSFSNPQFAPWPIGFGIFLTGSLALAAINESGNVFRLAMHSGIRIPIYAYYPMEVRELVRLLLKITAVQTPFVLLWATVSGMLVAHYLCDLPLLFGAFAGFRAGCVLLACRFIFAVFGISSGTNDTQRIAVRTAVLFVVIIPLSIIFAAAAGFGVFYPNHLIASGATAIAALDACIFYRVYLWFYHRNAFDLMSLPRR